MALPDTLGAEELRKAVLELFGVVDAQVAATGGHVAQRHADGCDIYFGFPSPVDKPVECGCATALGIVGEMGRTKARAQRTASAGRTAANFWEDILSALLVPNVLPH